MSQIYILVVDDELDMASSCQRLLKTKGYECVTAGNGEEALQCIEQQVPHLVITDLKMPKMDGMELLGHIKVDHPEIQVIVMTAFSTVEDAVRAMQLGAANFIPKPFTPSHLALVVEKVLEERSLRQENQNLKEQLGQQYSFDQIIGKSAAMLQLFESIKKIANASASVLVTGSSGTGKELIARSLHANSDRHGKAFVPINCGALPEHLVESEIFGYEKGAFTGAARAKAGLLEEADGGTFFLDEIAELSPTLQVKFLRVLEDGKFRRLGSNQERTVDFRLVCATNRDIEERVATEEFREDLFYRINTFVLEIPPLKDRPDDIPLLAHHFLQRYAKKNNREIRSIAPGAMELLLGHAWNGNVRELEHTIERAVILASGETIMIEDLPSQMRPTESAIDSSPTDYHNLPFKEAKERLIEDFERGYLASILKKYHGNISRAATHIGIDRRSLHRLLAKYELHAAELAQED
jgi:DNA-binding NtrC family response regulator